MTNTTNNTPAFNEGFRDFDFRNRDQNPWLDGSSEAVEWNSGFMAAEAAEAESVERQDNEIEWNDMHGLDSSWGEEDEDEDD